MCGIAGFIGEGNQAILHAMTSALVHRGPDAEGYWNNPTEGVYLGHRRLSIIDIDSGQQPMQDAAGDIVVVFNGEIYNHPELRSELVSRGYSFTTDHSDTEVLIHGYREWGEDLPNHLNGMWSFVIWDERRKRLFASRDRFGKKPLYYCHVGSTFIFASELTALLQHPDTPRELSTLALKKYYAYGFIPSPHSIYQQVFKLRPGFNLTFYENTIRLASYWRYQAEPFTEIPDNPVGEWGEELLGLLEKAVSRRMMSDVPLGVFLSGGIDSSAVTAIASKIDRHEGQLQTFSIGFDEASFDESSQAARVAQLFHTNHHCEVLSLDTALNRCEAIIDKLDEPMGDSSLLPTFLLSELTRKHVTVSLGGDGADELFAGYDPFRALMPAGYYSSIVPKPAHRCIEFIANKLPTFHHYMSLDYRVKRTLRGLGYPKHLWNSIWLGPLSPPELSDLFDEPCNLEEVYSDAIESWDKCEATALVDKTIDFYMNLYLPDNIMCKIDRAGMLNSLEVRSPFLDIDLVNFARKIPANYKLRNGTTKFILKKALESTLPAEVLYRKKKGFAAPIGPWFKDQKLSFSPNNDFERRMLKAHQAGKQDNRSYLWNSWVLKNKGFEVGNR
jgi:asparagine synthase (glutamine-hydrolysing)